MGEAKRRKQRLGEAYGKKQPPLSDQKQQRIHFRKFLEAATETVNQMVTEKIQNRAEGQAIRSYRQTEEKKLIEAFRSWLENYLANYEPEDRVMLASTYVEVMIAAFEDFSDRRKSRMIFTLAVVLEACKGYLDEETEEMAMLFLDDLDELFELIAAEEAKHQEEKAKVAESEA